MKLELVIKGQSWSPVALFFWGNELMEFSLSSLFLPRYLFPVEMDQSLCFVWMLYQLSMATKVLCNNQPQNIDLTQESVGFRWVWLCLLMHLWLAVSQVALWLCWSWMSFTHLSGSRPTVGWYRLGCLSSASHKFQFSSRLAQDRSYGNDRSKRGKLKCSSPFSSLWLHTICQYSH